MEDISTLIKEAKPLYFKRKRLHNQIKAFALMFVCVVGLSLVYPKDFTHTYDFDNLDNELNLTQTGSVIEDLGLPTDEYGLLRVV